MGLETEEQIASALAPHSEAADALPPELAGKVILLVDDDEELLIALAAPLRRRGYEVACATDAVTAISTALKQPPDVVIMDIGLPGGNGITVMQRLHSLPQLAGVPVLMVSGRDPEKNRDGALAAGAVAYFAKPVTPEVLSAAVDRGAAAHLRRLTGGSSAPRTHAGGLRTPQVPPSGGRASVSVMVE